MLLRLCIPDLGIVLFERVFPYPEIAPVLKNLVTFWFMQQVINFCIEKYSFLV